MRKLFIATLLVALAAAAQGEDFRKLFDGQTLYWENDAFGISRKSDRFYTQGAKLALLLSDDAETWTPIRARSLAFATAFCKSGLCGRSDIFDSTSFVFGQNFYTPEDITIAAPQPLDRPWAGFLYGGLSEAVVDKRQKILNYFEVQAGILGQGAGGQRTQKYVHNKLHFSNRDPQGWDNQLKNEPALNALYQHSRRLGNDTRDIVPQAGVMLGTVQTFASVGATARLGWHMTGFPIGHIVPAAVPAKTTELPHKCEAHLFAGAETRWVPWNATLQGGLFHDGPEAIGVKHRVTDYRAGVSLRVRWLRVSGTVFDRSKEFAVQPGHVAKQRFGSVALSIEPFTKFR